MKYQEINRPAVPDLAQIKRLAKTLTRHGNGTYMQYLNEAARQLYGVRHFHEARAHASRVTTEPVTTGPVQHYLRSVQEYYLDF